MSLLPTSSVPARVAQRCSSALRFGAAASSFVCALASVLVAACNQGCPQGWIARDGRCVNASAMLPSDAGLDASAQQQNGLAMEMERADGGMRPSLDAAPATMTAMVRPDAGKPQSAASADAGPKASDMPSRTRNCLVGATRCDAAASAVEVCTVEDTWVPKESCPATCKDGACAGDCKPGDKHCGANQTTETCSAMGAWTPAEACPFVCSDGECGGECSPGAKQCGGADGLTAQTCDESGQWSDGEHCANVCSSGSCSGSCMPGARRCRTSVTPELCSASGSWEAQADCPFLCSDDGQCTGECKPGSKLCDDQTPNICDPSGHWAQDIPCVNSACVNGVCGGACSRSERRCGPRQTPQVCSETGKWQPQQPCQFVCSGDGECTGVCSPNTQVCSGKTLQTCRGDGSGYTDMLCQPAQTNETASCSGNRCTSACVSPALKCGKSPLCWKLQYGCEQCVNPYVWREATTSDKTCVPPAARTRAKAENMNAMYPVQEACPSGLGWRLATPDDHRCVPADVQKTVQEENSQGATRTVVSTGVQP